MSSDQNELQLAILNYELGQVDYILKNKTVNLNQVDEGGQCPLLWAMQAEIWKFEESPSQFQPDPLITQRLLEYGADPNTPDDEGNTPLDYAIGLSPELGLGPSHPGAAKLLVSYGAMRGANAV